MSQNLLISGAPYLKELHDDAAHAGINHDALLGLADDDHTQYHTDARALTWLGTRSLSDVGTRDHDLLTGLGDDDHTQYLLVNGSRAMTGNLDMGSQTLLNPLDPTLGTHVGDRDYNDARYHLDTVDHGGIGGLGDDDHTQYALVSGARAFTGKVTINSGGLEVIGDIASVSGIFRGGTISANDYWQISEAGNYGQLVTDGVVAWKATRSADSLLEAREGSALRQFFPKPYVIAATFRTATDVTNVSSAGQAVQQTVACEYASQPVMVQVLCMVNWKNVPDGEQILIRARVGSTNYGAQGYIEADEGDSDSHTHTSTGTVHDHLTGNPDGSHTHNADSHSHIHSYADLPMVCGAMVEATADGSGNILIGFWADTETGTADIEEYSISYTVWRR